MEANLYELLGRKQAQLENQDAEYGKLLTLLAGVIGGEIDPSRVLVNLTDRTWQLALPGERYSLPATVNGLPVVVVAPQKECVCG